MPVFPRLVALTLVGSFLSAGLADANILIDDFATGAYDFDTSAYKFYDNGLSRSRFYFQDGSGVIGTHRMVVVANVEDNSEFDGTIGPLSGGGGLATAQGGSGYQPYVEYDYGVRELLGDPHPWQFANLNADFRGHEVIRYHFLSTSGNVHVRVSFNSPAHFYHDSPVFDLPNSDSSFILDIPLTIWSEAELSNVNQIVFSFWMDEGGSFDITKLELVSPVPEPTSLAALAIGTYLTYQTRRQRRKNKISNLD